MVTRVSPLPGRPLLVSELVLDLLDLFVADMEHPRQHIIWHFRFRSEQ